MLLTVFKRLTCVVFCFGQLTSTRENVTYSTVTSEGIGNFSLELLYHTTKSQTDNVIMSPFNIWSALAVTAEGAIGMTLLELRSVLRIANRKRTDWRSAYQEISREVSLNTTTIKLYWFNSIFLHKKSIVLEEDYRRISRLYDTFLFLINFADSADAAMRVNVAASVATYNRINKLAEESDFSDQQILVTSAAYFTGLWTAAFNVLSTSKQPFYDGIGVQIGEVNMMYNRHTYPLINVPGIQANVIQLPYGAEEQVSLLVMLPYPGVSLMDMYRKFVNVPLPVIFAKLKLHQQVRGREKVDCFIPRFTVESNFELKEALKQMGINRLFDGGANLERLARLPIHVAKVLHKAVIEVTEEGIAVPQANSEFTNAGDVKRFEANRPFAYFVFGDKTNTVLYQGLYQKPYLY